MPEPSVVTVLGVTGSIGAGKSTVTAILVDEGWERIDMDMVGRELLKDQVIQDRLKDVFGADVVGSNGVDRTRVAERAFASPETAVQLNSIMHPEMMQRIELRVADLGLTSVVIDGALLFEMGVDRLVDGVICVTAPDDVRYERLFRGRGWSRAETKQREAHQMNITEKLQRAAWHIENNDNPQTLTEQVQALLRSIENGEQA